MKTLKDWPKGLTITQYLRVGDKVDNAMYEHFLNILPPKYHYNGVLQVGGACDTAKNKYGVLQQTYLTFVEDTENDCWVFKGECCPHEVINRNSDLEPKKDLSLSEVPTETLLKMQEEAFSDYYAEATKPCGNWTPDMTFPELDEATKRLNEINDELARRTTSNTSLADKINQADIKKDSVLREITVKQAEMER